MYRLTPTHDDPKLFFRLDAESAERHGAIGYMRADYSEDGYGFRVGWFDIQPHLKTRGFRRELDSVVNDLRTDGQEIPFANRKLLAAYCADNPGGQLGERGDGYLVRTDDHSYYFRCRPVYGDYDIYCFAYDNSYLLPELAGQHDIPTGCYSLHPSTGEIILIRRGEQGYTPIAHQLGSEDEKRAFVDAKNAEYGVTRAQEEAMLAGSIFGFDVPGAKPWKYDMDGNLRPKPKRNEPQR